MYGRIFQSMFEGSMAGAGPVVIAVWSYCIAKADKDGIVLLNPAVVAAAIGTSHAEIESAIEYLTAADPHSKNPEHEGRRLLYQTGYAYKLVSHEIYQNIKNDSDRRDYMREYMRERRKKEGVNINKVNTKLTELTPKYKYKYTSISSSAEGDCKGESAEPAVIEIPLIASQGVHRVTQKQVDEWAELFPGVEILQTLREILAWNQANPTRRKTRRGVQKHIVGWLSREQNKA